MIDWNKGRSTPYPLGATWVDDLEGYNFSIYSKSATRVQLLLFNQSDPHTPRLIFDFDPHKNKTGTIWHCIIPQTQLRSADAYAYRIDGPQSHENEFNWSKLLVDPWAKAVFFPPHFARHATKGKDDNIGRAVLGQLLKVNPLTRVPNRGPIHTHDLIIYELHVKGFTQHPSSGVAEAINGTFSGLVEKIPYLRELGVTAVELMPVHQYDILERNYWGYMTLNFFAPHSEYCVSDHAHDQIEEFKSMVRALHSAGIEVILDVVYNHTSEGGHKDPFYSYKGIDRSSYYLLKPGHGDYIDDAGTGNVLRTSHKVVRKLILDSLRYWVEEMGVHGFRFDLASLFTRNDDGSINTIDPPILEEISNDPVLSKVRLIAEPWDVAVSQLGHTFPASGWPQWNGEYRDDVRKFIKGDGGLISTLINRLNGSPDLFPDKIPYSCRPTQSINFVTAHDGFTLYDLVAYNQKHNWPNGHDNTDGSDHNYSWNCGQEGDKDVSDAIMALRKRQVKNFITILMLSNGVPMFRMGDEWMHTQQGNNNAYNQDNEISWLDWNRKEKYNDVFRFFKSIIAFRKQHPTIHRNQFWKDDVTWYGTGGDVDYNYASHSLAYHLKGRSVGDSDLYVMINAYWEPLEFHIQTGVENSWKRIVDTSKQEGEDIVGFAEALLLSSLNYTAQPRSIVVLERMCGL